MDAENQELGPFSPVSDMLVLAAVQRAQRHRQKQVPRRLVAEHLGFVHSSATTRRLRPQLESLRTASSLDRTRKHGLDLWTLTPIGSRRLAAARRAGKVGELPESPQHRRWRHAEQEAGRRMDDFRGLVYAILKEACTVASQPEGTSSKKWFELSERLRAGFWLVGSVTYCRDEWPEPNDAHPDQDEDPRSGGLGRRQPSIWDWEEAAAKGNSK